MITVKIYEKAELNIKEILRYAGCSESSGAIDNMLENCIQEVLPTVQPRVCYTVIDREIIDSFCDYSPEDSAFRKYMEGINGAVLFAASIGFGIDKLIAKYEKLSMTKAQLMQAIGAQQVEALCDRFCDEMKLVYPSVKPRFSPGYGGLELSSQKLIFDILECNKKIGVSLSESCLMSPSKSVSAFMAIR